LFLIPITQQQVLA